MPTTFSAQLQANEDAASACRLLHSSAISSASFNCAKNPIKARIRDTVNMQKWKYIRVDWNYGWKHKDK